MYFNPTLHKNNLFILNIVFYDDNHDYNTLCAPYMQIFVSFSSNVMVW